ncbi:hypothetical protein BD289DRAFT_439011 [Coniella lustricola]|uniref:Zn(2)-C6 fungal-type domain-containing protein n=1 Tax=Coniella lustricola TaxID=2025994 RepID=A0A2T3A270_9PEZI|nr:hypothetical protein BD289DRAFT_439011 [Coniella lustricola]
MDPKSLHQITRPMPASSHQTAQQPSVVIGARACANCAKVKCKCIYRGDGPSCERCYRLKKHCAPTAPASRILPKQRSTPSRTARLEKRLEELVTLLRTQHNAGSGKDQQENDVDEDKDGEEEEDEYDDDERDDEGEPDAEPDAEPDTPRSDPEVLPGPTVADPILTPAPSSNEKSVKSRAATVKDASSSCWTSTDSPSPVECQKLLDKFRNDTLAFFPFVNIPGHVSPQQMRDMYPFLWLNIVTAMSASPRLRTSLAQQAKRIIIHRVVVNREKSTDMLFGLLTFLAWSHLHPSSKPHVSLFSQLLVTLLCDLGLDRRPPPDTARTTNESSQDKSSDSFRNMASTLRSTPTIENRRLAVAVFLLTSVISRTTKRADGLRWSPYLNECLSYLAEAQAGTVKQDALLVSQVKMELIVQQIHHAPWPENGNDPPVSYLSALASQVDNAVASTKDHPMVLLLYHYTNLIIHGSVLNRPPTAPIPWSEPDLDRFEGYNRCLGSISAWVDSFLAIPIDLHRRGLPFGSNMQLLHVLSTLHSITTVEDPVWDRRAARGVIDLVPTCDRIIGLFEKLKAAPAIVSPDFGEEDAYVKGITILTDLKMAWQVEMARIDALDRRYGDIDAGQEVNMTDNAMAFSQMALFLDPWSAEILQ